MHHDQGPVTGHAELTPVVCASVLRSPTTFVCAYALTAVIVSVIVGPGIVAARATCLICDWTTESELLLAFTADYGGCCRGKPGVGLSRAGVPRSHHALPGAAYEPA